MDSLIFYRYTELNKYFRRLRKEGPMKKVLLGTFAVVVIAIGFCGAAIKDKIPAA